MTNGTSENEYCPEFKEYMEWCQHEYIPKTKKFYEHMATCLKCQQFLLANRDKLAMKSLTSSDEEFINMVKKMEF